MSPTDSNEVLLTFSSLDYMDKIQMMVSSPIDLLLTHEAAYVAMYLAQFRPCLPPEPTLDNETSVDIADQLSSICSVDINTVSRIMMMLGYRLCFAGGPLPEWSMRRVDPD